MVVPAAADVPTPTMRLCPSTACVSHVLGVGTEVKWVSLRDEVLSLTQTYTGSLGVRKRPLRRPGL